MSPHTLEALRDRGITPSAPARLPFACTTDDLERANIVVAMKEAEHRQLVRDRFSSWEQRVIYLHVHDLDTASVSQAIEAITGLVTGLVRELEQQDQP